MSSAASSTFAPKKITRAGRPDLLRDLAPVSSGPGPEVCHSLCEETLALSQPGFGKVTDRGRAGAGGGPLSLKSGGVWPDERPMGSFTELMISFTFAADTPDEVLMAFSPWRIGDDPPHLPSIDDLLSHEEQLEIAEEIEMKLYDDEDGTTLTSSTSLHRAVAWCVLFSWGDNAYFPGPAFTELRWDPDDKLWTLNARTVPKASGEVVQALVRPLGAYALEGTPATPARVAVINDEDEAGSASSRVAANRPSNSSKPETPTARPSERRVNIIRDDGTRQQSICPHGSEPGAQLVS